MNVIVWILFGLLAGTVAKFLMPGKDPGGCFLTMALGIIGAVIGGWVGTQLGWGRVTGFNLGSFLLAVLGSILLLAVLRLLRR